MTVQPIQYQKPTACNLTKLAIEEIATAVAKATGFESGQDIEPVVNRLGGRIEFLAWDSWYEHEADTIRVDGPRNFCISLLGVDGPLRHRFTIAHELGHYVLHSRVGKIAIEAGRKGSNREEWEANWFAAAFLMPTQEFKDACVKFGNHPLSLAGRFLVSEEAAKVRMKTLNIHV